MAFLGQILRLGVVALPLEFHKLELLFVPFFVPSFSVDYYLFFYQLLLKSGLTHGVPETRFFHRYKIVQTNDLS